MSNAFLDFSVFYQTMSNLAPVPCRTNNRASRSGKQLNVLVLETWSAVGPISLS